MSDNLSLGVPVPPEAVEEFKQIWKKEFGEELSDEKAHEEARDLLVLMKLAMKKD